MKPRADDDWIYPTYLGIGTLHQVAAAEEERSEPPGIWLPMHRSGSRLGGWQKRPVTPLQRQIGFRPR